MFKIYKNRKTNHPSISIKSGDKQYWHNIPISHTKFKNDTFIIVNDPHPNASKNTINYVRKYIRKDKHKIKGRLYKRYRFNKKSETLIKNYLKKKR